MNFEKEKTEVSSIRTSEEARKLLKVASKYISEKYNVKVSYSKVIEELVKDYLSTAGVEYNLGEVE